MSATMVLSLYRGLIEVEPPRKPMRVIAAEVAERHGVPMSALMGPSQRRPESRARQEAYAEMYATGRYSLTQIGRFFARDHTSVLHGVRVHIERAKSPTPISPDFVEGDNADTSVNPEIAVES